MRRKLQTHQVLLVFVIILTCQPSVMAAQALDISAELSRAQSLYTANQFEESLILLTELEKNIGTDPQKTPDLLKIELYIGLAQLGLNETDRAKSKFIEVCKLDSKYTLNPEAYPPNAVALFNEVKGTCAALPQSPNLTQKSQADATFLSGKELYEKGEFKDALKYFNVVLALDSGHELAREYSKLAQQWLALSVERGYLEWSVNFNARQFEKAAATYMRIRSDQTLGSQLADQIEAQYKKALSNLIDAWKGACAARELPKLEAIRNEASNFAPGLAFSRDALDQMQPCPSPIISSTPASPASAAKPRAPSSLAPSPLGAPSSQAPLTPPTTIPATPTAAETPVAAPSAGGARECIKRDPEVAISRLSYRVNPEIPPSLQQYVDRRTVVKIAIDEKGSVFVKDVVNADPRIADALQVAVEQWKFNPIVIDNEARCVETELPIALLRP
jgi:tetratricopeptide (TPR) repeat protein